MSYKTLMGAVPVLFAAWIFKPVGAFFLTLILLGIAAAVIRRLEDENRQQRELRAEALALMSVRDAHGSTDDWLK